MTVNEIKQLIDSSKEYEFLKTNPSLNENIILMTIAGSYSFGINTENSDIDVRGCFLNSKREILTGIMRESFSDSETDTVLYNLNKFLNLLLKGDPNVIEMLGVRPEFIVSKNDIGQELINMRQMFLSKKIASTFLGYANAQLKRIKNTRLALEPDEQEEYYHLKKKACKNMVNLIRLYAECHSIFTECDIITYREKEHSLLMDLRNGCYMHHDFAPTDDFYRLVSSYESKLMNAIDKTKLPEQPDVNKVYDFLESVNFKKVNGQI